MRKFEYTLVDVFTNQVFGGNQLAVFKDAEKLSSEEMQSIARELNFPKQPLLQILGQIIKSSEYLHQNRAAYGRPPNHRYGFCSC